MTSSARLRRRERAGREREKAIGRAGREGERERERERSGRQRERERERERGAASCLRFPEPNVAQVFPGSGFSIQCLAWKLECVAFSVEHEVLGV